MALIRQASANAAASGAVVLDLGDLAAQGEMLKARARAEADRILAAARDERERLVRGAAAEGHREGLAKGLEDGRKQGAEAGRQEALGSFGEKLKALEASWMAALASFEADRDRMLIEARQDVVRLAAAVGELVTKRAVALEPGRVVDQLSAVLALIVRPTRLVVAIHPDDEAMVREALPGLAARVAAAAHVELAPDPSLGRGSCVARSGTGGEIDASIKTQLERIVEVLLPGGAAP